MAKYEEKFIVVNTKHLTEIRKMQLIDLLNEWGLPNHNYYSCNQDEPYAKKVLQTILEGEDQKANSVQLQVSQSSELLPCPFCGLIPTLDFRPSRRGVSAEAFVRCGKMICKINPKTGIVKTKEQAIKIWNKRASQ